MVVCDKSEKLIEEDEIEVERREKGERRYMREREEFFLL